MVRKRIVLLISMGLVICLAGCGEKDNTAVTSELETTVTETVEADSTEDSTEEEVTTEQEPVKQQTEENVEAEPEGPQNEAEWAALVDKTEPRLTIWNNITKEGTVLENGNEYTVKEGDQMVICYDGEETAFSIRTSIIEPYYASDIYKVYNLSELPTELTEIEFAQTVDGIEYIFKVSVIAESSTN